MTAHIESEKEEIAKRVLMPGDPLRAKYVASKFLTDAKCINETRGMLGFTGKYKGVDVTIFASGMGGPSIGIYAYELYKFYDVECIIRIGSCGGYSPDLELLDVILVDNSYTESNFAYTLNNDNCKMASSTKEVTDIIEKTAIEKEIKCVRGNILSSDCFDWYVTDINQLLGRLPKEANIIGAEMESFGLFYLAKMLNKKCACSATVVDSHSRTEQLSAEQREKSLNSMISLALESTLKL